MTRTLTALLIAAVSTVAIAQAPANPPVRIRGTVERIDRTNLTVKANSGQSMNVKLADNFVVIGIAKASLSDIASGKFIGTTTVGERDGAQVTARRRGGPRRRRCSAEVGCPGRSPVRRRGRLAVPPAVDGDGDRVEARLVARVSERVQAVVLPEPARRHRRVARLGDAVRIGHDGGIRYRLRIGLVVVAEGELYQTAPAILPAVAARLVAV